MTTGTDLEPPSYALGVANGSYEWYRKAAIQSRRCHRASVILIQVLAATIPIAALVSPDRAVVPGILGAVIAIVSAVRGTFHWQDNYIRFSAAREGVEAQRRLYLTSSAPYGDPHTRDKVLVAEVTALEGQEMANWRTIAAKAAEPRLKIEATTPTVRDQ